MKYKHISPRGRVPVTSLMIEPWDWHPSFGHCSISYTCHLLQCEGGDTRACTLGWRLARAVLGLPPGKCTHCSRSEPKLLPYTSALRASRLGYSHVPTFFICHYTPIICIANIFPPFSLYSLEPHWTLITAIAFFQIGLSVILFTQADPWLFLIKLESKLCMD